MPLMFLCDRELHDGADVAADYFVVAHRDADSDAWNDPSFAACADHLLHAVRTVMAQHDGRRVQVRLVTGVQS